ncbi:hypothetical protein [Pantoea sp. Sc1]|uniref:GapS6a family protein n=1 Tax=Pantoea sp. Sc1 TaxID=593105 RepID=UPI0002587958|nr:hypothetical protein [Pantoea sp. Sc1]EIB96310.1 hypothetical protein S7A_20499 [Pantoea sp. Sc1]
MEPITTAILARGIYELLQSGITWSKDALKERLQTIIANEVKAELLAQNLQSLDVNKDMSESAIEKKIAVSSEVTEILKTVTDKDIVSINQHHTGSGDNVGRDKIIKG